MPSQGERAIPEDTEKIAAGVIDAAFQVHEALGPGLLESAYEHCLAYELQQRGITVQRQVPLPVVYREVRIEAGYRIDLIAGGCVLIEIKAIEAFLPIHHAQLMTYLRLSGCRVGFLMNFNVRLFKSGVKRVVL